MQNSRAGNLLVRSVSAAALVVVAPTAAGAASPVDLIGASKGAYTMASLAVAAAPLAVIALIFVLTRRPDRRPRRFSGGLALIGAALLLGGVAQQIAAYHPFDPDTMPLRLICHANDTGVDPSNSDVSITYRPDRRCVNGKTVYVPDGQGLTTVVLVSDEVATLKITSDPYGGPPFRFTRLREQVSDADIAKLTAMTPKRPVCPPPEPAAVSAARERIMTLRRNLSLQTRKPLSFQGWSCRPASPG